MGGANSEKHGLLVSHWAFLRFNIYQTCVEIHLSLLRRVSDSINSNRLKYFYNCA